MELVCKKNKNLINFAILLSLPHPMYLQKNRNQKPPYFITGIKIPIHHITKQEREKRKEKNKQITPIVVIVISHKADS